MTLRTATILLFAVAGGCAQQRDPSNGFPPIEADASRALEQINLQTVGPSGQRFEGTLIVDGTPRPIDGVTPAEFPLTCALVEGDVRTTADSGTLGFVIVRDGGKSMWYTPVEESRCRFRYHAGGIEVLTAK
jgi:hypothetical protein